MAACYLLGSLGCDGTVRACLSSVIAFIACLPCFFFSVFVPALSLF